jgi:signal peptidase I
MSTPKKLIKNDHFKTIIVLCLIVGIFLGGYFGLQFALGVSVPVRVVESGSMCVDYGGACDGWSHIFEPTLHRGDILIIEGVAPQDLNANYPNSDIIVYDNPYGATPIVHRIVSKEQINGTWYFKTKGDGNGPILWPNTPDTYDNIPDSLGVPQNLIEGRVVMRIPLLGLVTLFMRENQWALPLVIGLILVVVFFEFVMPKTKTKTKPQTVMLRSQVTDVFINPAWDKTIFKGD